MRRLLLVMAGAVVAVALPIGISELSDLTQTRADPVDTSRSSIVVFDVRTQSFDGTVAEAATAQWWVCAGTVGGDVPDGRIEQVSHDEERAEGRYRVVVTPAIGPRGEQRLRGCLDDAAVDRVLSSFVSIEDVPAI
jgi:hypothetical protein